MPEEISEGQLNDLIRREWILPNGRGGYAFGTMAGINTRKYHGLLISDFQPDGNRYLCVGGLEEQLIVDDHRHYLSAHKYASDAIYPMGYMHLEDARIDTHAVQWRYGGFKEHDLQVEKEIYVSPEAGATVIEYRFLGKKKKHRFGVTPFIGYRNIHEVKQEAPYLSERGDGFATPLPFHFAPEIWTVGEEKYGVIEVLPKQGQQPFYLISNSGDYLRADMWYHDFQYDLEKDRGYPFIEDLYAPGTFWKPENDNIFQLFLIQSTDHIEAKKRLEKLLIERPATASAKKARTTIKVASKDLLTLWTDRLTRQSEDFLVRDATGTLNIIAGYPWFGIWSRDALLSLEGVLLATGRHKEAALILRGYAAELKDGLLPNIWEESHRRYAFVGDAPLLFAEAVYQYYQYTGDKRLVAAVWPSLCALINRFGSTKLKNPHLTREGLITLVGDGSNAATWMDAIAGGRAVSPRYGTPVEIQALWFNALRIVEYFQQELACDLSPLDKDDHDAGVARLSNLILLAKKSFKQHFYLESGYLADVASADGVDDALRPNQLFALGLSFPLITDNKIGESILDKIEPALLTQVGLRTLSPDHPDYRGSYRGSQTVRDEAYHQGTIWPWLLGIWGRARLAQATDKKAAQRKITTQLEALFGALDKKGLYYLPEVFGGEDQQPEGTVHQAWNVGQVLALIRQLSLAQR